jgi:hypothetical protein
MKIQNIINFFKDLLSNFISLIVKFLNRVNKNLQQEKVISENPTTNETFKVISVKHNKHFNYYDVTMINKNDVKNFKFINIVWNTLNTLDVWKKYKVKVIMVAFLNPETEQVFYIHKNVAITHNTTVYEYFNSIKNMLWTFWESGSIKNNNDYKYTIVKIFPEPKFKNKSVKTVKISNIGKRSYSTAASIGKVISYLEEPKYNPWQIKPVKRNVIDYSSILCTLDVETIKLQDNIQIPILITFSYMKDNKVNCFIIKIDPNLLLIDKDKAIFNMWKNFYNKLKGLELGNNLKIYSHNLGAFDGYFILPSLLKYVDNANEVDSIIDDKNKFISIKYKYSTQPYLDMVEEDMAKEGLYENDRFKKDHYTWTFLDSYRLFPVSLNELCKIFGVEGKLGDYNSNWNNISLFNNIDLLNQFIEYAKQDSISLLNALINARKIYLTKYNVDILKAVSTPSLSLLIYRHKFQKMSIPIFKRKLDNVIRDSYFGGSSDYYKLRGTNLKYYDVNSLYPYAMLNDMPLEFLGEVNNLSVYQLNNFFGFIDCIVSAPNIKHPLLLYRNNGKIIHPTGTWRGTYFSEELKEAIKHGYNIQIIKGYSFSRANLFKDYIDYFYDLKKNSTGAERFIAKLHLNTLYGMFGRKLDILKTVSVSSEKESWNILNKHPVKSIITVSENLKLFLIYQNLDFDIINKLNTDLNVKYFDNSFKIVKSNVAIASAITAYARIVMMKYKTIPDINIYYTDTDSIFIDKELPANMVGKELGQMKDELDGGVIKNAYFFGIKQYAYIDNNDKVKSVFSGIGRNEVSWEDVLKLKNNETIVKQVPDQFFKSLQKLEISIKPKNVNISFDTEKVLIGNNYQNIHVKDTSIIDFYKLSLISKIKNFFNRLFKFYN